MLKAVHFIFHWTESNKIRYHSFTCVIALTLRRLLEVYLEPVLGKVSAEKTIEEMRALPSLLIWQPKRKKTQQLEDSMLIRTDVLKALGYGIDDS